MARKKKSESITLVSPEAIETSLAPSRAEAEGILAAVGKLNLSTQVHRDGAGKVLAGIREKIADLEEQRKAITGPINEAKRRVDALFKPIREYWEACDKALTGALLAATEEAKAKQLVALNVTSEAAGHVSAEVLAVAHATPQTPEWLQERVSYKVEIVDRGLIPELYFLRVLDEPAVFEALKAGTDVPGAKLVEVRSFARSR